LRLPLLTRRSRLPLTLRFDAMPSVFFDVHAIL
jgi:hypothetical protein